MVSFKFLIINSSEPKRHSSPEGVIAAVIGIELQGAICCSKFPRHIHPNYNARCHGCLKLRYSSFNSSIQESSEKKDILQFLFFLIIFTYFYYFF